MLRGTITSRRLRLPTLPDRRPYSPKGFWGQTAALVLKPKPQPGHASRRSPCGSRQEGAPQEEEWRIQSSAIWTGREGRGRRRGREYLMEAGA